MANIILENDKWETSGVYDITEGKTQRQINASLQADITDIQSDIGDMDNLDTQATNLVGAANELKGSLNTLDTQTNSVEWRPASGDTLLAFILANVNRTKLPFSFVRVGNATVTDAPSALQGNEFTGFVVGCGDRILVQVEQYTTGVSQFFQRTIYQNRWLTTEWTTFTKSEQPIDLSITQGTYTVGGMQYGRWINGICEVQGTLNMSGYQANSTIISIPANYFKGNTYGLIFTDGGGKTWFPRARVNGADNEIYVTSTLPDGWYNFFLMAFNQTY